MTTRLLVSLAVTAISLAVAVDHGAAAETDALSRIVSMSDFTLRSEPACDIRFAYAGHAVEDLFWEEPCSAVTARMMTHAELQALDKWDRLDEFDQGFVEALPGGRVLYVEGRVTASIYPIGTENKSYEVPVSD